MMFALFGLSAISFLIALLLTPVVRDTFLAWRIVDAPDGERKIHSAAVPRVGGIAVAAAYLSSLLALAFFADLPALWADRARLAGGLLLGGSTIFFTGILDDLFGLRPLQKLGGQLGAALILCASGIRITSLGGHGISAWVGVPLTIVWLAVCTNAFNLIDGLDGLAAGMGVVATLTTFGAALLQGNQPLALTTLPLAASLAGFLVYNFNPASVFLGDSGSLLVGYLLGSYAIVWSEKSATLIGMAAPLMALAIPLLEVCLSVTRRALRGKPIFSGDRSHIHHKLLERGLTHRRVVLLLYAVASLCAVFALAQSIAPVGIAALLALTFCAAALLGIQKLGYLEFDGARRALSGSSLMRSIRGEIAIGAVERQLNDAPTVEACWHAIRDASRQMGFSSIEAMLCGRPFHDALESVSNLRWQLRVPLGDRGFVQVGRSLEGPEPAELAPFVEMLHTRLLPRLVLVSAVDLSAEHATAQLLHLVRASDAPSVQAQDRDGDRVTR